ncbi:MAG: twin-arginine translocase subunit TatB [Gammaproteobacteria bacterium]|nr:Sec-independent protein translocase protein TatB [Gammaproteobacteria bacterium]NND53775.1 twin-arginine translocase subunit TatB [Gammaproteobacteria bacterium]
MFDIGFWELVILFGLGLLVLGPERMPRVAAKLGRWVGQARNMARHLNNQIRDEIEPFESGLNSVKETLNKDVRDDFRARRPEPGQPATDEASSADSASGESGKDAAGTDKPTDKPADKP